MDQVIRDLETANHQAAACDKRLQMFSYSETIWSSPVYHGLIPMDALLLNTAHEVIFCCGSADCHPKESPNHKNGLSLRLLPDTNQPATYQILRYLLQGQTVCLNTTVDGTPPCAFYFTTIGATGGISSAP